MIPEIYIETALDEDPGAEHNGRAGGEGQTGRLDDLLIGGGSRGSRERQD